MRIFKIIPFIFIFMLSNFLTLPLAFSQENQGVDRRAYFERAHESLGFLLQMGFMDHDLMSRLSKSEASMIQLITELALEMDALRFFEKNNVQRFGAYPKFSYHYTIWDNKVVDLITDAHHSIRVHFSEDQRIFQLHPNEPIRTAVTESELEKPIYINLKMIQNEQIPVDFAKAVSLMVHEYGHKLGNQKNQEAIDSMASKFEDYVRTRTIHENVNGVRFEALYFTRFEKYGEFLQNILQGEYRGVNVPPKIYPLNVYANQGVYVFANREGKIKDLTSVVVGNITKNKLVTYVDIPQYTFAKFDLVLAQSIDFSQSFNGEILIKVNANLLQLVLPFMNYKSYEPKEFQLYQKVFQTPNYESEFYGYQFELDSETLKTNKVSKTNLKFSIPEIESRLFSHEYKNKNLDLYFEYKGDLNFNLAREIRIDLWPEIQLIVGSRVLTVKADQFDSQKQIFRFRIQDVQSFSFDQLVVTQMSLKFKKTNLAISNGSTEIKVLMPQKYTFQTRSESLKNEAPGRLKSVQIWNGQSWVSVHSSSQGKSLRFLFEAQEPLRELILEQKVHLHLFNEVSFFGQIQSYQLPKGKSTQPDIHFEQHEMQQRLIDGLLEVIVDVDNHAQLRQIYNTDLWGDGAVDGFGSKMGVFERSVVQVAPQREVLSVSYLMHSGVGHKFDFQRPLVLTTTQVAVEPTLRKIRPLQKSNSKALRCEALFNPR